jgi:hypothetical protein
MFFENCTLLDLLPHYTGVQYVLQNLLALSKDALNNSGNLRLEREDNF